MSHFKLSLLGPPRLERDDVPVEFDTRKNIVLVAFLAMSSPAKRPNRQTAVHGGI